MAKINKTKCMLIERCEQISDIRDYQTNGVPENELLRLDKRYKETCITPSHTKCEFRKAYSKI